MSCIVMKSHRSGARVAAFAAVMVALANVLSAFSIGLTRVGQIGVDLSNLAVFIGGIYGGPVLGFLIGLLGGTVPGIQFGPLGGLGWLGLFGLTFGKSLTGLTTGALRRIFGLDLERNPVFFRTVLVVLMGYVPEFFFTIYFFLSLAPYFLGPVPWVTFGWLLSVLAKGWAETAVISIIIATLTRNAGFNALVFNLASRTDS